MKFGLFCRVWKASFQAFLTLPPQDDTEEPGGPAKVKFWKTNDVEETVKKKTVVFLDNFDACFIQPFWR